MLAGHCNGDHGDGDHGDEEETKRVKPVTPEQPIRHKPNNDDLILCPAFGGAFLCFGRLRNCFKRQKKSWVF